MVIGHCPRRKAGRNVRLCIAHSFSSGHPEGQTDGRVIQSVHRSAPGSGQTAAFPRAGVRESGWSLERARNAALAAGLAEGAHPCQPERPEGAGLKPSQIQIPLLSAFCKLPEDLASARTARQLLSNRMVVLQTGSLIPVVTVCKPDGGHLSFPLPSTPQVRPPSKFLVFL